MIIYKGLKARDCMDNIIEITDIIVEINRHKPNTVVSIAYDAMSGTGETGLIKNEYLTEEGSGYWLPIGVFYNLVDVFIEAANDPNN